MSDAKSRSNKKASSQHHGDSSYSAYYSNIDPTNIAPNTYGSQIESVKVLLS